VYLWHDARGEFAGPPRALEGEWIPEPPGRLVFAPDASRRCAVVLDKTRGKKPSVFEAELSEPLPAGHYRLVVRAKTDAPGILEKLLIISLQAGRREMELRAASVAGSDFEAADAYREFSWGFVQARSEPQPIVLKFLFTGRAALTVDYLDIRPAEGNGAEGGGRP
ncbi:MAG: hypothetical protein JW742_01115, partial [Candidatus Aminicenantes bacterium]|nr:hypothetical protein [Candidatus Aminicenantes bacterium]